MLLPILRSLAAVLALSGAAAAADIAVDARGGRPLIRVSGEIDLGDAQAFSRLTQGLPPSTVVLSGPGGKLIDALTVGEMIRARGDTTLVEAGASCTSACALMWIAGAERTLGDGGQIGFHAASAREGDTVRITASGNAIVGAYLTRLGFPLTVVVMATEADYTSMQYLTAERASASGLAYRRVSATPRRELAAALPLAVATAPPPAASGLAAAAGAPAEAAQFVDFWFATVNAAPAALRTLAGRTYADSVLFRGARIGRAELIRREEAARARFPAFRLRPAGAPDVSCNVTGELCLVAGEARFTGRDGGDLPAAGVMRYELTLARTDGWFRVAGERIAEGDAAVAAALQRALARLGCDPGPVDGRWGRRSRTALERFAAEAGLALGGAPSEAALAAVSDAPARACGSDSRQARAAAGAQGRF